MSAEEKQESITFRCTPEFKARIEAEAARTFRSVSGLIQYAINLAVNKYLVPDFKCIICGQAKAPQCIGDKRCADCFTLHQYEKSMTP